jgi:hypothetical protein
MLLDSVGRQDEIARMLSGAEVTSKAGAQADRLLSGATRAAVARRLRIQRLLLMSWTALHPAG